MVANWYCKMWEIDQGLALKGVGSEFD